MSEPEAAVTPDPPPPPGVPVPKVPEIDISAEKPAAEGGGDTATAPDAAPDDGPPAGRQDPGQDVTTGAAAPEPPD